MTTKEKINLLIGYRDLPTLTEEYFAVLEKLSTDKDPFVRSLVAPLIVDFVNEEGKSILFRLAKDKDELTRTEAYDSLSVFSYNDVEIFLEKAMQTEWDELARGYAITSWADVVVSLVHNNADKMNFLLNLKLKEKTDRCMLCYCYAQYIFGDESVLDEILKYLQNEDYQIRCSTLSLLRDIVDDDKWGRIKKAIKLLLVTEDTVAVKDSAMNLLEEMQDNE